jgi:hypothetical protein
MAASNLFDFVGFTPSQSGPGGASIMSYGEVGGATPQAAGAVPSAMSVQAAPLSRGFSIPPVIWMFVFLIVGYWGLHQSLKYID